MPGSASATRIWLWHAPLEPAVSRAESGFAPRGFDKIDRRRLIGRSLGGLAGVALTTWPTRHMAQGPVFAPRAPLVPIQASQDRMVQVTVCLRPFRAAGPRIEAEAIAGKHVVHHYGHGGSGWSLSWGSAQEALPLALAAGETEIAVIGAGAIGLTTAITAQRMGATVTIYAKERFPLTRSSRATGSWTPDSRVAMEDAVGADFASRWERMARAGFARHQSYLGLGGNPVEWTDRYILRDTLADDPFATTAQAREVPEGEITPAQPSSDEGNTRRFVDLHRRLDDITPQSELLAPGSHPFDAPVVKRSSAMTYNIASLSRQLESEFLVAGGRFVQAEFHEPSDMSRIRERVVVNCTGYGARALFRDESLIPVRGQIAWLIPQEGVAYGVHYKEKELLVLARRDGIVVQPLGKDDFFGFEDANENPDEAAARAAIALTASLFRSPVQRFK